MDTVRIAELKARLSEYLRAVRRGRTLTVLDRDRPVARIVPYDTERRPVTIQHGEGAPPANRPKVLAQARLELGDPDGIHDHNIVITSHLGNLRAILATP